MPVRLVNALNRHTPHRARLVDTTRWDLYEHDVVFDEDPKTAAALAESADIIHLHNYLDCDSREFAPIDFRALRSRGVPVLRHFHSLPGLVAERMGVPVERVLEDDLPSVVIAQYPERFFPRSMVVPNFVPQNEPDLLPASGPPQYDIFFSHTKPTGAWENRWNTKGAPETRTMLKRIGADTGCSVRAVTDLPLAEVLPLRRSSRIVLDELVNGSYHLSALEGLAVARPVLAYLDARTLRLLREFSGSDVCPFINVRLEEAEPVLRHLLAHPELAEAVGRAGRQWLEEHWSELSMIRHFENIYAMLREDPALVTRQPHLAVDGEIEGFMERDLHELIYAARAAAQTGT